MNASKPIAAAAALAVHVGSGVARAQEIEIWGPLNCAKAGYCYPYKRTRLELALQPGVSGEIVARAPAEAPVVGPAAAFVLGVEGRLLPARWHHGPVLGLLAGPPRVLRPAGDRMGGQFLVDIGYGVEFGIGGGGSDDRGNERYVLGFAKLGLTGRRAWFDNAPAGWAAGPLAGVGVDVHHGDCGRTLLGFGLDVRYLRSLESPVTGSLLFVSTVRLGWDLPQLSSECERD